ncbi:MAG: BlaI/MecI/CopY family transcriptional regulator [Actinomadura rubrobrunea]|nr:BlaI/MecI/CopY family transcriptional regulator [Actinomadura rubrobrunea]
MVIVTGKSARLSKLLGPLGAEVMEVMWEAEGPLTVRQVMDRLNHNRAEPLAYTTVMTVLARLADREALVRTLVGRGYAYEPAVADAAELAVRGVIREYGVDAVASFVDQARTEPHLLSRLEKLMRERNE